MPGNDAPVPESEVKAGFQAMLEELKVNSRPHLTTLTILAGEYREFAQQIVGLIENQLGKVRKYKLPIMYLIDSIIKEFPEEYVPIFSNNLVQLFVETFKVQVDARTKMYDLRTTWDDVFAPDILFKLDLTVKQIDRNWPMRVKMSSANPEVTSSSDEFSSASAASDGESNKVNNKKQPKSKSRGHHVAAGFTGAAIKSGTPNSSRDSPQLSNPCLIPSRKLKSSNLSRPSSHTASPRSVDGNNHRPNPREHRYPSLDDRLSSLPSESRIQSSEESPEEEQLVMVEPLNTPPKNERLQQLLADSSFVPPPVNTPGSVVSSPRHRHRKGVETGVQAVCTSTTREVQTGHFTKNAETMTKVATKDAQTQKKLRKPKVAHFTHQFTGLKRTQAIQATGTQVTTGTQWSDKEHNSAIKKNKKLAKGFEFRQAVEQFRQVHTSRMADSILRRLHDNQKQGQLCDLTISIGTGHEDSIRCHKHIVAMVSDVIQVEAMEKDEIIVANISKDTLGQLVDYCYTGMIGPFVSKEQIEAICDGVKKLKIRQLDMVVSELQAGLSRGQDYFHSAISGNEIINSDIITAAMLGQALPTLPQSSAGLIDLFDENGAVPFEQEDGLMNLDPMAVVVPNPELKEEVIKMKSSLPFKKRLVQQETPSDSDITDGEVEEKRPEVKKVGRPKKTALSPARRAHSPKVTPKPSTTPKPATAAPRGRGRPPKNPADKVVKAETPKRETKVAKKRNLSESNNEENAVKRKSRRSAVPKVDPKEDPKDENVSVLDALSEPEEPAPTPPQPTPRSTPARKHAKIEIKECTVPALQHLDTQRMMPASEKKKTPKKPRKSLTTKIIPGEVKCPWIGNATVTKALSTRDRAHFKSLTGHSTQCMYLASLYGQQEPSDDES